MNNVFSGIEVPRQIRRGEYAKSTKKTNRVRFYFLVSVAL